MFCIFWKVSINSIISGCQKDLHQKLIVMKMMSANAMDVFINLIQKCYEQLVAPWKQNEPFSNPQCTIFVNIIHPLLDLTENLFKNMATTSFCFKDSRLVQQLFSLHKILCTKPPFGYLASVLTDIQEKIIAVLVLFMQGTKDAPESEDGMGFYIFKWILCWRIHWN